jgi:hypothetical protein
MIAPATPHPIFLVGDRAVLDATTAQVRHALAPAANSVRTTDDLATAMLAVRRERPTAVLIIGADLPLQDVRALIGLCHLGRTTPVALIGPGLAWVARRERIPWLALPLDPAQIRAVLAPGASAPDARTPLADGPHA